MATKTSSTVVIHAGEHLFKIVGHSQIKDSDTSVTSSPFRVGDHDWTILYYPNGRSRVTNGQDTFVFLLMLDAGDGEEVTASFSFCLQDPASPATAMGEKHGTRTITARFSSSHRSSGPKKFVSRADLAASGCLKDDRLVIKCTVGVFTTKLTGDGGEGNAACVVVVPPSNLTQDFSRLLESGLAADVTIKMGSFRSFKAHRCVLAARSPVFRAQLCGSMMESTQTSIRVEDMDARVFEALLHYMYNDTLPEFMEEDQAAGDEAATNMAQHLLVAADRYAMERLKLMCESKLSKALDVRTVGFTLDFAERHHCRQLKDCCLEYVVGDAERMKAIVKTEGFTQLKQNYPLVACEILDKVAEKL